MEPQTPPQPTPPPPTPPQPSFSRRVLDLGFLAGLGLAAACMLFSGYYMIRFQRNATSGVEQVLAQQAASAVSPTGAGSTETLAYRYRTQRLALAIHSYIAQTLLLSCGVLAGMAFGFLGFSLFLIGVQGASDLELDAAAKVRLQVSQLAPGVFVLLCSTVLIGVCVTREQTLSMNDGAVTPAAISAPAPGTGPF